METNHFWPRFFPEKHVGGGAMEGLTICHFRYCLLKNVIALPDDSDFLRITLLILFYFGNIFCHSAHQPDPQSLAPSFFKAVAARDQEDRVFWRNYFSSDLQAPPFFGKFDTDSLSPLWNKLLKSLNLDGAPSEIPKDSLDLNVPIIYWFLLFDNYGYEL